MGLKEHTINYNMYVCVWDKEKLHNWQLIENEIHRMEYKGVKLVFEHRGGLYYAYCEKTGLEITGFLSIVGGGDTLEHAIKVATENLNMFGVHNAYKVFLPAVERRAGGTRPGTANKKENNFIKRKIWFNR